MGNDTHTTQEPQLNIGDIIDICPQVGRILDDASDIYRATDHDYIALRRRLSRFVGWGARDNRLCSPEAYEAAVVALAGALRL
jgi:hypothetical protein